MARQKTFGDILREARERKGMDVPTAARRLRIRPDILQIIEQADFDRMPPRGYTRNMVHAYARMVGLNPTDLTRMYLDDDYAYQASKSRNGSSAGLSNDRSFDMGPRRNSSQNRSNTGGGGRVLYDSRQAKRLELQSTDTPSSSRQSAARSSQISARRGSAPQGLDSLYSGPSSSPLNKSKVPFFIIGGVVALVIILALFFVLGGKGDDSGTDGNNPDVVIPGVHDTSNPDNGEIDPTVIQQQQILITPDRVTVVYAVPSGSSAYIEVYEKEGAGPSVAQTVNGPSEKSFNVTETLTFVTTNPDSVVLSVGNKRVELEDKKGNGVYTYEVNFDEWLAQWKIDNQPKTDEESKTE